MSSAVVLGRLLSRDGYDTALVGVVADNLGDQVFVARIAYGRSPAFYEYPKDIMQPQTLNELNAIAGECKKLQKQSLDPGKAHTVKHGRERLRSRLKDLSKLDPGTRINYALLSADCTEDQILALVLNQLAGGGELPFPTESLEDLMTD